MIAQPTEKQLRRWANERAFRRIRRKQAAIKGTQPLRKPAYLVFVREHPCVVCLLTAGRFVQLTPTEAAHVGERGLRQKCSDYETIPLCAEHHRTGPYSHHVLGKKFWKHHDFYRELVIEELRTEYTEGKAA